MKKDTLVEIFKKHLQKIDPDVQGVQDLVYEVVGEYMAHLMKQGNIPHSHLDELEYDLREEAIEIYRKVTYGHLNLKSYKDAESRKSRHQRSS
jgi:hypothetical protein